MAVLGTLGFPEGTVPDGFAVPFYFYDEFMKHNELYDDIEEMLADPDFQTDFDVQEDELKDLRKAIKKGETPEWIIEAVTEMHATYSDGQSLRYRSSTNNEDLPGFNGAGLYDSKTQHPEETEEDGIAKSLKQVYASLWNFRAFTEREFHRIDHLAAAMGVLVHPNYSGELANGVAVSFDPFTSRECCYYVNTQIGEDLVTNPDAHSVPEEVLLRENGYNVLATSNQLEPGQLLLSDDQMTRLRQHLEGIHEKFKDLYSPAPGERFAIEIEFKITSDDILAIKQARPWVFSPNSNTRATGLPTISGTAQVGETLTASISGIDDADGLSNVVYSYQWLADNVDINGATSDSYTLGEADVGKAIKVRVSFTDNRNHQETLTSEATAAVEPNRLMGTAIFVGGVDLEWTEVPGAESYEVQLFRNVQWIDLPGDGVEIAFYGAGAIISQLNHDGYSYWFQVRANNAKGSSEWSDPYLMQPTNHFEAGRKERPENVVATGAPAISGTAQVGKVLTADASAIEDGNGLDRVKFQYQWVSYDGTTDTDIEGATESAYRLQAAEEGKTLKVRVSFTDRHGYAESVTSAETATVLAAAPNVPPTGAPTISGPTHVSGTLTASLQGIDDQNGLRHAAFRYRWTATEGTTDTVVQDSENPIYVLEEADEGKTVQVDATFTDDDGYEETLHSAPTGAIGPRPNRPTTGDPTIVGTVQVGETLTVDISDIEDADGLDNVSFSYQWLAGDADIAGAAGDSYTLVADDKDKTISVRVSFTDRRDFEETLTSAATAPVEGVPDENSQRVDLHILNAPVGEREAVLYRSTATLTPVNHIGNTHDSREDRNADFKLTGGPTVTLPALDRRQVGELAAAISATALTIPLTSVNGLRVGESIELGANGGELMRVASVDSGNKTITVVERYKANGGDSFVEPSAWPADTVVYHHRRARPERLPDYMVESGKKPSFANFRMSWSGLDVPYLAINMSFAGSDTELKDWRELLVYLRFRRAGGEGRMVEGILPLGADGEMNLDDRQPGNPYTVREQHLRRYFGWPEDLDNDPDASVEVSFVDDARRKGRFISGDERTFLQDVVDWIYADDGHDLGRIYPMDDRYDADEVEALQASPDTVSEELVRSYQVVVDVAFLDGTDPRIDTDQFSILTSGGAYVIDLGDIGGTIASSTRSGSVNRSGDEYDHYRFTLSVPREVQLELTNLSGAAELVLESGSRTHLLRSDESGLQDELIITVLDAGVYQVRVQAQGGGTIDYQLRYRTALPAGNSPATGVPSISGTVQVGETLTVDTSGIDDADGMSGAVFSYQWLANDAEIAGATDPTYTLVDGDAGLTVKVKVSFFDDKNNPETLTSEAATEVLANVPGSPEHLNVSLHDTGALDVSWKAPATDGGSAITEYRIQWKETAGNWDTPADVSEETATGTTHTITGLTDGVEYAVRVIAVNDEGDGPPSDEATGTPWETTPPGLSTATVDGATLTLTYDEGLDENSEPSSDAFSVTVGGTGRAVDEVLVAGSAVTLTLASAVTPEDAVTVSYTVPTDAAAPRIQEDAGNPAASFSDQDVENNTSPPANTPATGAPSIGGTAQVGETLTASTSAIDDADGLDNVGYSYQWLADDTEITGATSSSYTLVDADAGLTIKVKVSFFDDKNNPETLTSVVTTAVLANVPGAPEHLNVSLRDTGALDVSWETPSTDGGSAITEYRVQWKETAGNWDTPADVSEETATGTTHTITGLTDGVEYAVRIIATNDVDDGPPSDEATGTPTETTPPELSTATVDGATLTLTYDEDLDENSEPSSDAFSVTVGGTGRAVDGTAVEGDTVTLTLASAVTAEDTVTVSYTVPTDAAAPRIQDDAGNPAASFSDQDVGNNTPPPANTPATGAPTITGTARASQTLAADISGIGDDDGLPAESEFDYQWIRNDGSTDANIAGATDSTYVLLAADVGKFIKVRVTFTDKNDYTETLTSAATTAVAAAAPAPGPITGFTVVDASDQSVEGALADGGTLALDDPVGGNFGIRADLESGATIGSMSLQLTGAKTHDQTENIAPYSLYGDSGGNLSGESLPVGEYTLTATAYSEARLGGNVLGTLKVSFSVTETATQQTNTPATGAPIISGTAQEGETLTVDTSGIDDADGMSGAVFSYQWLANEVNIDTDIAGATDPTYTLVADDVGKAIRVRVSFDDDRNFLETLTSEATATVVTPLTAEFQDVPDKHDGTGFFTFDIAFSEPISISYKTLRDDSLDVTDGSATKAKRVDGQSDLWEITVEPDSDADVTVVLPVTGDCTAQDAVCTRDGTELSNRSELTVPGPAAANSPATGAPIISGTAEVGETLTVDTSGIDDADGMSGAVFSYQWLADGVDIAGATGDTYTLVDADFDKAVKVRVIFNDDDDNEETLTSEPTAAVAAKPNSPATGAPTISGTVRVGEILTAHTSDIADADGMSNAEFGFNWWAAEGYLRVTGVNKTYRVQSRDVGLTISVSAGFMDDAGNLEILSSAETGAVPPTTPAPPQSLNVSPDDTGTLDVSWEAPASDGGSAITGYKVQWKSGSEDYDGSAGSTRQAEITDPASRTHTITGLTDGVAYAVRVIAVNDVGDGPPSDEATGTPRETTPPELSTATVDGAALTLTYDEDLDENSEPSSDAFSVTVGGTGRAVDGVSVSGSSVILTLGSAVTSEDTVTVSYTAPTDTVAPRIQDDAGNPAASFSDQAVENNTPPPANSPATGAPTISGTVPGGRDADGGNLGHRRRRRDERRGVQLPVAGERRRCRRRNERHLHPGRNRRWQDNQGAGDLHRQCR